MIEYFRKFNKPEPINELYEIKGTTNPCWIVNNKKYHSKYYAIKACVEQDVEWPTFRCFEESKNFKRPSVDFYQSCADEAMLISDTSKKVRLWYSGGRDSHHVLEVFLRSKSKLDEICTYRRFPAVYDDDVNEYDRYNVLDNLKKLLKKYDRKIPIKIYDVMPEHFEFWANHLEERYFPYTEPTILAHSLQPLFEFYPELLEDCTNIKSDSVPFFDGNGFSFLDSRFNDALMDPYVCHFFCDSRNLDLPANIMYHMHDNNVSASQIKDSLNFFKNNTPLDSKIKGNVSFKLIPEGTSFHWLWDMKHMRYHMNMIQTENGCKTLKKFIDFYTSIENKYSKFFNRNSIYHNWIGSPSETHKLIDI